MKSVHYAVRVDARLARILSRLGNARVREILAQGVGKPELSSVSAIGRPRKPAEAK